MKRSSLLAVVLSLVISLAILPSALARESEEGSTFHSVKVRNLTDRDVVLTLYRSGGSQAYQLVTSPKTTSVFPVLEGVYTQSTQSCGKAAAGALDVSHNLRLVFTPCRGAAPNQGAPYMEKIHLFDAPYGIRWAYRYYTPGTSATPSGGACQYTATGPVTIYSRPDNASTVFSNMGAGFTTTFSARTKDGWYGFEPGVAQAANIGPFRLRWIHPEPGNLSANCQAVPILAWTPKAGICYFMPMTASPVHQNPDTTSPVLVTLQVGEFAEVLGQTAGGDWSKVDLGPGNTGSHAVGWVDSSLLNISGPCSLPTISP